MSGLTFEKVFRYCYENHPKQDGLYSLDSFHELAACVWDYEKNTFVNLDKEIIVPEGPIQNTSSPWGQPIKGSFSYFEAVEFYHIEPHKIFEAYDIELFRLTLKGIHLHTIERNGFSVLVEACEIYQNFFFVVHGREEVNIPYAVFENIDCVDYKDLFRKHSESSSNIYWASDNKNKQFPHFKTKDGEVVHNLEFPDNMSLNGAPHRLVLKSTKTIFSHKFSQSCKLGYNAEKMYDKDLLKYAPQRTADTRLRRSCSDYFMFIPRELIK